MDAVDPSTLTLAAAAVGGAVVFGAVNYISSLFTSKKAEEKGGVKQTKPSKPAAKKKSKKKKKASKAAKVPKSIIKEEKQEKEVKTKKVTVQEPPKEEPRKKKKKAKKKKKPVLVESDSSDDEEDFLEKPVKAKQEEKVVLKAADFFDADKQQDIDGWQTVPVKKRKSKPTATDSSSKSSQQKRDKREVVAIGDNVGIVLGEGGATISNIQNVSGAKVTVNKEARLCVITGDEESVAVAKQLVVSLVSNQAKHTFTITSRLDKAILAKQDTKQTIKDLSGAKVEYSFGKSRDDPLTVVISGETDKVEQAKSLVNSYLDGKTPEGGDGVKRIKVTGFQGRILIGVKGSQINEFQKESGASINVEFMEDNKLAIVSVIGDEEQISTGLAMIQAFLVEHNVKGRVDLDPEARGVLLKLNDLRKEIPNLQVDVSPDRTEILLCGSASGIRKGNELLLDWIAKELGPPELRSGEVMECVDLGGAAGKVIGKSRSVLNNIIANSGAKIEIKKGTLCYVYGQPSQVKKAFKDVNDIVSKHNEIVAKSQQEQQELQSANWVVIPDELSLKPNSAVAAPESDWGGFKLAQSQGW